jgi:hypothetical protein
MPLRYRHGYAVDLHRGLPGPAGETCPGVHRQSSPWRGGGCRIRTANQPIFTGLSELARYLEA